MSSWDFFDLLLVQAHVVGTPGSGFGTREDTQEALRRIARL